MRLIATAMLLELALGADSINQALAIWRKMDHEMHQSSSAWEKPDNQSGRKSRKLTSLARSRSSLLTCRIVVMRSRGAEGKQACRLRTAVLPPLCGLAGVAAGVDAAKSCNRQWISEVKCNITSTACSWQLELLPVMRRSS